MRILVALGLVILGMSGAVQLISTNSTALVVLGVGLLLAVGYSFVNFVVKEISV